MADTDKASYEYSADEPLDVLALSYQVEHESASGKVAQELLKKGQTLYAPTPEGDGLLSAHRPDGSIVKGRLKNGIFVPVS